MMKNATVPSVGGGDSLALTKEQEDTSLGVTLAGIDLCLRSWTGARHEGQAVLTGLSNAVLLRTYVDNGLSQYTPLGGSNGNGTGGGGEGGGGATWGALATAGATVARVSVAAEARARRLHGDLSALQDAMLAAARGLRGHAQDLRRRCCCLPSAATVTEHAAARNGGDLGGLAAEAALEPATSSSSALPGDAGASAVIGGGYGLIDVADAASEVAEMMLKEALVTATVVQGVGGGRECRGDGRREALTMYSAAWMMQPYIDARLVKELEKMAGGGGGGRRA